MNMSEKTQNQEDALESQNTKEGENPEKSEEGLDAKTLLAQKEYQREKREVAETENKELKAKLEELQGQKPTEEVKTKVNLEDPLEMLQTVKALQDYSADELGEIRDYARGKGISLAEAAKSKFVQAAITQTRSQVEAENKVPGTTNRGKTEKGTDFSEMSDKDIAKDWSNVMQKAIEQGKGKKGLNI